MKSRLVMAAHTRRSAAQRRAGSVPFCPGVAIFALVVSTQVAGCAENGLATTPMMPTASAATPSPGSNLVHPATPPPAHEDTVPDPEIDGSVSLSIAYPLETAQLVGGQSLRVTAYLVSHSDEPVQDTGVKAEIYAPSGDVMASLPCTHHGQGRYLSDLVRLPLRNAAGTWRIVAEAEMRGGATARDERTFPALPSYSERLEQLYGFWIELSDLFAYNVPQADDPCIKYWPYDDDNSGYVILANSFSRGQFHQHFVILDVHWQYVELPTDEASAIAYVRSLAGPHRIDLTILPGNLAAERLSPRNLLVWNVRGEWTSAPENGNPRPSGIVEWQVSACPASGWVWTVVIATNESSYLDELRSLRETFQCPASESAQASAAARRLAACTQD